MGNGIFVVWAKKGCDILAYVIEIVPTEMYAQTDFTQKSVAENDTALQAVPVHHSKP
jgi:hypothetical protein